MQYRLDMRKAALIVLLFINCFSALAQTQSSTVTGPPPPPSIHPNTVESSPILVLKKDAPGREKSTVVESNTIADNIKNSGSYSQFYKLIEQAGLSETFKSAGPITLFLPDNVAFEKMPKAKLDTLMRSDHQLELVAFVTYYAIPGKLNAHNIEKQIKKKKNLAVFKTVSGAQLKAKLDAANHIVLVDELGHESTITMINIKQSNGMMFVISDILLPKNHMI